MPGSKDGGSQNSYSSQPLINDVLGPAKWITQNSGAWKPNTTSQVTPFSKQTMSGLTGLQNTAQNSGGAFNTNFNRINSTLADGGLNNLQDQQVSRYNQIASGQGLTGVQNSALNLLNPIAQGKEMNGNPYLDQTIARGSEDIINANKLAASGMGRSGSTDLGQTLNRNVADFAGGLRFNDYNNQLGRRDAAIQNVFNMGTTGQNQKTQAMNSLFDMGSQQRNNILNGTKQLSDAYAARKQPYQDLLNIGGAYEGKNQALLNDQARIFNEKKNSVTDPLNWLANLANAFQGGQQVTNYKNPSNPLGGGIGGLLSGYALTGSPFGGLLGGLGGAFM